MPQEFGAWSTVSNRFRQWRDAGVFEALLEGLIAEAEKRGEVDLSLVSIDSTTVRAHHDAAGMHTSQDVPVAWRRLPPKRRRPGQRGRSRGTKRAGRVVPIPSGTSGDASGAGAGSG